MAIDFKKYGIPTESPAIKVKPSDYSKYGIVTSAPEPTSKVEQTISDNTSAAGNFLGGALYNFSAPGRTIQNVLVTGAEKLTGKDLSLMRPTKTDFEQSTNTNLDTTSAKVGGLAGEVATFAVPGGFAAKATRGANILTRLGAQAVSDATVQSLNQGEVNKNTIDAAILGAVFPAGSEGLSLIKNKLAPQAGAKVINSLIKPLLKDFSYGKNPGRAVAESGITANSLDDLASKIKTARQNIGTQLDAVISASNKTFEAKAVLSPLDDALKVAEQSPRTNSAVITRINNIRDDILRVNGEGTPTRDLSNLSAKELWELNKEIGSLARWTGNASDDEIVNKAIKQVYGKISSKLDAVPNSSALKSKYADLRSAEMATEYRDKIAARQNLISLSGLETGVGTGIVTAIATGGITVPLLVGATAAGLTQASKTPAVKTRLAAWLAQAGREEIQSAFKQAPWLRATLQSILFGEDTNQDTPSQ